ncbi:MAG: endo-1,4-beta-xylanase [Sedimentisphaerales bacterium]|nr:endo-1,4-beta-xylanase [Sedimentisphaerales bacterium]
MKLSVLIAGVLFLLVLSAGAAQEVGDSAILAEADARIQQHRRGQITLKVLDPQGRPLAAGSEVEIRQINHAFLFGCNIFKLDRCRTAEDNRLYEQSFADLFNFATLPFYWWTYTPRPGQPNDARTERIADWCRRHRITCKGHPLAWNFVDPPWLPDDPAEAMRLQMERIARCVGTFQGAVEIWDVVNEATAYDRPTCWNRSPKLTRAIQQMQVGPYLRQAFQAARLANPQAVLIINDYRTDPAFAEKVLAELVDDQGQPLYDVIGIQSHMHGGYWGPGRTWQVCQQYARFGRPLHFTETTILSGSRSANGGFGKSNPQQEAVQARQVEEFYRVLFSHPAVAAVTWWDFTDQNAWQGAPAGLIRDDMSPKPAYERLRRLIKHDWWTGPRQHRLPADGTIPIEGFYGTYEVSAQAGDRRLTGTFRLDRDASGHVAVRLSETPSEKTGG